MRTRRKLAPLWLLPAVAATIVSIVLLRHSPAPPHPAAVIATPEFVSALATWPWPHTTRDTPHPGVTHWSDTSSPDGTVLDLFDFDFGVNPHLKLEIYDQDAHEAIPFDNKAKFWNDGVGQITRRINLSGRGKVVAAWNGLFFDFDHNGPAGIADHLTPVVLDGMLHYPDAGNHRWTFGVQYLHGKATFQTFLLPDPKVLEKTFDFAAGAAQCLIHEGKPLTLQPFPRPGEPPRKRPIVTTLAEAGHIPDADFIKTSRASLGWSGDSRHLYLLYVEGRMPEMVNALHLHHNEPMSGGWSLHELQQFWSKKGVWGAINSDGGDPAQMTYLRPDGNYILSPPHWSGAFGRRVYAPDFHNAPHGGVLMYFVIRDDE